jgi:hypothetical protein
MDLTQWANYGLETAGVSCHRNLSLGVGERQCAGNFKGLRRLREKHTGAVAILSPGMFRPVGYLLDICHDASCEIFSKFLEIKKKLPLICYVIQYEAAAIARISTVNATRHNALTKIW